MKVALIGYGKMGKTIEKIGVQEGFDFVEIIDQGENIAKLLEKDIDVAIEFTQPLSAFKNIKFCLENNIKVISGTTGWVDQLPEMEKICIESNGTFLYASNFSVGVNLFFEMNEWLAQKMANLDFQPEMLEVHHSEKKDSPSGTAITLAHGIIKNHPDIKEWTNEKTTNDHQVGIISERKQNVPGTHAVSYTSDQETIEMTHTAHDRSVFAQGVLKVAKWISDKNGFLSMSDFINNH